MDWRGWEETHSGVVWWPIFGPTLCAGRKKMTPKTAKSAILILFGQKKNAKKNSRRKALEGKFHLFLVGGPGKDPGPPWQAGGQSVRRGEGWGNTPHLDPVHHPYLEPRAEP